MPGQSPPAGPRSARMPAQTLPTPPWHCCPPCPSLGGTHGHRQHTSRPWPSSRAGSTSRNRFGTSKPTRYLKANSVSRNWNGVPQSTSSPRAVSGSKAGSHFIILKYRWKERALFAPRGTPQTAHRKSNPLSRFFEALATSSHIEEKPASIVPATLPEPSRTHTGIARRSRRKI